MAITDEVQIIFADAKGVYSEAVKQLDTGDIRDAAEKAWCATKRATDALILAVTGEEPRTSRKTMEGIRRLRKDNPAMEPLRLQYAAKQTYLHGACFYDGDCEPVEDIVAEIRQTSAYIALAEEFARNS